MKKIFSLLFVFLLSILSLQADDVSKEQALQIASQFASHPSTKELSKRKAPAVSVTPIVSHSMKSSVQTDKDNIYVINMGNDQGFVIVSGESGTDADILGYCDHGSFCYDSCPVQLKDLLNSYSAQIDSLRKRPATVASRRASSITTDMGEVIVGPLLTTTWDQMGPYNNLCPEGCPTGCYPTALAQVMNYWKWPKVSSGQIYTDSHMVDFSGHTYDWDNMLDNYSGNYTAEQAEAVATLMADIGAAFGTVYMPEGSRTPFEAEALVKNFGYEMDYGRSQKNLAYELVDELRSELNQRRPVLFCGSSLWMTDPHALVCDGYTTTNYFHFNFGWGGVADGYYKNAASDFSANCYIFTNIRPYDAEVKVIGNLKYGLFKETGTADVIECDIQGYSGTSLEIPATVTDGGTTYKVTRIREQSFYQKGRFDKITIGDNVEAIDAYAFFGTNVDTLILSDKMTTVPVQAFMNAGIKNLTIGSNIRYIGKRAFYMCRLTKVTSKSPAFEVGEEAFAISHPDCGEWLGSITKIGKKAFFSAVFDEKPYFAHVEEIADSAFTGSTWLKGGACIPATLKRFSLTAFTGALNSDHQYLHNFDIDDANPYFSGSSFEIFNKNKTSLILLTPAYQPGDLLDFPETMVKMEPGSIMSRPVSGNYIYDMLIPATVVEMEGAFMNCETLGKLTCLAVTPPVITDATFNDKIFENTPDITLHVPEGTEELYANAPGWRRFPNIVGDQSYEPMAEQQREWRMVLHRSGDSSLEDVRIPVSEITDMHIADNNVELVVTHNGSKGDVTTHVAHMDSITWEPCFVYEDAEVFELNDSTLTAEGQKCSVTFGRTVIDHPVQLAIRNGVLTPRVTDLTLRGQSFDLSLSDGTHELKGVATITVPFTQQEGEQVQAAYFNEESGEWEPAYFKYADGEVTIMTNHLSEYCVFTVLNDGSPRTKLQHKWNYSSEFEWNLNQSLGRMYEIASGENIDEASIQAWRDDYSFWQSIGLDGGHNLLSAAGLTSDAISKCVDIVGYLGTAATVLDVAKADLQGDDVGVASNTLKAILGFTTGQAASAIGTSMMSVSMAGVAFIGVALEQFGTMVQKRKTDLYRAAYRLYYSERGRNIVGNLSSFGGSKYYRTETDWYDYFYPAFQKGMKDEKLRNYIEQSVRMYCERFWDENGSAQSLIIEEAKTWGLSTMMYPDEALRKTISDEYFAELMNGTLQDVGLPSVFQQLKHNIEVQSFNRYKKARKDYIAMMNTDIGLQFIDSQCKEGERSKFAGWKLRFKDAFDNGLDTQFWEREITEQGRAKMGWYTLYAFLHNGIKNQVTLVNPQGVEQKTFTYQVKEGTGRHLIEIDLATGGTEIEAPALKDLRLTYDPALVNDVVTIAGQQLGGTTQQTEIESSVYFIDNLFYKNFRWQSEIERFFKKHDFITVDKSGNIKIGDDIVGKFNGDQGTGNFTIDVTNPFTENSAEQFAVLIHNCKDLGSLLDLLSNRNLLSGTISYKINCNFTVTRSADSEEYTVEYTGSGTFSFSGEAVDRIDNVLFSEPPIVAPQSWDSVRASDITTREVNQKGTVTLEYTTKLQ